MSFGVTELIIIAVIVLLLFGTSKLKNLQFSNEEKRQKQIFFS